MNRFRAFTMNRFRAFTLLVLLAGLLAVGFAYAQGPGAGRRGFGGPGGPGGFGRGGGLPLGALSLTETQQQQIRDVTQQHREQNRTAAEQLRTAMEAQRKAVETIPADEGLIRSTTQTLAEALTETAVQRARLQSEIFLLLTPAQQEQAKKLLAERQTRLQQRERRRPAKLQGQGQQG